jgi:hypothetical protein
MTAYLLQICTPSVDVEGETLHADTSETELFDGADAEADMRAWARRHGPWTPSCHPLRADAPAPVGLWFQTSAQIGVDVIAPAWVSDDAVERITTVRATAGDPDDWHRAFIA